MQQWMPTFVWQCYFSFLSLTLFLSLSPPLSLSLSHSLTHFKSKEGERKNDDNKFVQKVIPLKWRLLETVNLKKLSQCLINSSFYLIIFESFDTKKGIINFSFVFYSRKVMISWLFAAVYISINIIKYQNIYLKFLSC